jgi:hypothetical protein
VLLRPIANRGRLALGAAMPVLLALGHPTPTDEHALELNRGLNNGPVTVYGRCSAARILLGPPEAAEVDSPQSILGCRDEQHPFDNR